MRYEITVIRSGLREIAANSKAELLELLSHDMLHVCTALHHWRLRDCARSSYSASRMSMALWLAAPAFVSAWSPAATNPCVRRASVVRPSSIEMNFFAQAQELIKYKARHVGTMCTVQHVVVASFEELNKVEAEVKAAGSTEEAMAEAAAKYSLDQQSAKKQGTVGPFMLGQKEFAFEKVCFDGDTSQLLPCKSSAGFHLIKINRRGMSGPDGKIISDS